MRARVLIRPKAGILDPQGQAVERALPALGFSGVSTVHVGRLVELDVEDADAAAGDVRAPAGEPAHRGLRDHRERVKFGVIRFPGTCDDVDAQLAAQRVADAELLWHRDRDLKGVDAVVVPGGFSYGDYLRAGAIARFAPVMESVIEFAQEGGLVLGICNGFQILCECGLLPGALLVNDHLKFVFRQVSWTSSTATRRSRATARRSSRSRSSTRPAATSRPSPCRWCSDTPPGQNPNGSQDDIAGVVNNAGNVFGLMPHPEHAVDPLTGSADGLSIFESIEAAVGERMWVA